MLLAQINWLLDRDREGSRTFGHTNKIAILKPMTHDLLILKKGKALQRSSQIRHLSAT